MATQTRTARQAAGEKAAPTRKRNAAKRSATGTKASARQTTNAARGTARAARSTAQQSARTAGRRADEASSRLRALTRQAERAVLIPVGAALEARDAVIGTVRIYSDRRTAKRRLDRFERRGERAIRRNRRRFEQGVGSDVQGAVDQIRNLV
jgi:hypothetical protein